MAIESTGAGAGAGTLQGVDIDLPDCMFSGPGEVQMEGPATTQILSQTASYIIVDEGHTASQTNPPPRPHELSNGSILGAWCLSVAPLAAR